MQYSIDYSMILVVAAFACVIFLAVSAAMAVGVMFGRRAISGSCGGLGNQTDADGKTSCSLCDHPADACRELRDRMKPADASLPRQSADAAPRPTASQRR